MLSKVFGEYKEEFKMLRKDEQYKSIFNNNKYSAINVYVKGAESFFKQQTFFGFKERSLTTELEQYILNSMKVFPVKRRIKLVIHTQDKLAIDNKLVERTIHAHFTSKYIEAKSIYKQQLKNWVGNLIIGILFLILCLMLVEVFESFSYIKAVKIFKESLMIIGWVALWEPVTFILFQWRSIKKDKQYFRKLSTVPIVIVTKNEN